jgi:hypothetical protein
MEIKIYKKNMNVLDQIKQYASGKKHASSNIQLSDGTLAYVTNTGVVKKFNSEDDYNATMGKNNCPSGNVPMTQSWSDLGFPVGSLMVSGQSCGYEASYVQTLPPSNNFDWQFYIQNYPDLQLTTEEQAIYHWNTTGKQAGLLPNASILTSMTTLGKVGYVDADAVYHSIPPTYNGTYNSYPSVSNVTGTTMADCTKPRPPVKYGDQLTIQQGNLFGSLNKSSNLHFSSSSTNFFIRPPVNSINQNEAVKYGDEISITSSASSYTSDCGWWGCKVAKVNPVNKHVEFGQGGESAYTFKIIPPMGTNYQMGTPIKYGDTFTFMAMVSDVNDTLNQGNSLTAGQKLVSKNGKYMLLYQTDGNVCIYSTSGGSPVWSSGVTHTPGKLKLQPNGNLVAHDSGNIPQWSTKTANKGTSPFKLVIQNDRNLVLTDSDNVILWKSNTNISDDGSITPTTPYFSYVDQSIMKVGLWKKSRGSNTFSFVSSIEYKEECDLADLKNQCNISDDCSGFIHDSSTNSWQMIQSGSSESDYKVTNTQQDIYMKKALGQLNDSSCHSGDVNEIDASIFSKFPKGNDFEINGKNQCMVIQPIDLTPYNESNTEMYAKSEQYVKNYKDTIPDINKHLLQTDAEMKKKTAEYKNVLNSIKSLRPSTTLAQQESDLEIVDKKNKITAILWGILAMIILAIIMFRPK